MLMAPAFRLLSIATALVATSCSRGVAVRNTPADPASAAQALLAADRGFSAGGAGLVASEAIGAMLHGDVEMRAAGGFAVGREAVMARLRSAPYNIEGRAQWTPTRGGISADGLHGFTAGWLTLTRPDGTRGDYKYIAYWMRTPAGWRARLYRIAPRAAGAVSRDLVLSLPPRMVAASSDSALIRRHAAGIDSAERAFSAEAGRIGLGPAFTKYGAPEAINMGGPEDPGFVVGPVAIGKAVGQGEAPGGSKLTWAPEHVLAASSGDLGATVGYIDIPAAGARPAARVPFFTIWRRDGVRDAWRYVAE